MRLGALLLSIVVGILAAEIRSWASPLAERLVRLAARTIDVSKRARYSEEWREQVRGLRASGLHVTALVWALGILVAAPRVALVERRVARVGIAGRTSRSKRVLDIILASAMLFLVLPLYVFVALAIRLTSAGPVFVRLPRLTKGGRVFNRLRFRTMAFESAPKQGDELHRFSSGNDPQLTRVGRILRALSLDELPLLVNVVRGEMSLVDPRPPAHRS